MEGTKGAGLWILPAVSDAVCRLSCWNFPDGNGGKKTFDSVEAGASLEQDVEVTPHVD